LGLLLLVGSASALAEMYTWVDEQGNVHFSDTPPPEGGAKQVAPEKNRGAGTTDTRAAQLGGEPIPYRSTIPSRRLAITEVRLALPATSQSRQKVGREYRGFHCNSRAQDLFVDTNKKLSGASLLARDFHLRLAELGYQPPAFGTTGRKKVVTAELTAVASVTEVALKACKDRRRTKSERLPRKNRAEVSVRWEVYDRLTQELVFERTTRGLYDRWSTPYDGSEKDQGIFTATRYALMAAAEQLLAQPELVALLSPDPSRPSLPASLDATDLQLERAAPGSSFQASLAQVRAGTAVIRTVKRNGHGFLLSADGYVITNFRIIADGVEAMKGPVMVVFENESIPARVVRSDRNRNAALLKLERRPQTKPLPVAGSRIGTGETVHVVGGAAVDTPSHTISEGVITAHRSFGGGTPFYQTNAKIDRDNPTGPAFNDRGEVVALASGVVDPGGRRPGVFYLIPIDDALRSLGLSATAR
jgi:S1-C subfamily serine protease